MSITVQHRDNAYWGPHVFLEGTGDAEEIRGAYARESPDWPPLHLAIAEATPEALDAWYRLGFAQMHAYGVCESGGERVTVSDAYTADQGYLRLPTNWRVTNLYAPRFWPARGFEQTHIRLARRLPDI